MPYKHAIVVIGCSQGGIEALTFLVKAFEPSWRASIFITSHIGRRPSQLARLLNASCRMPVSHAQDLGAIELAHVYIAPPDHHLCIGDASVRLSLGPRVNWTRPAIDPMFRSAAEAHGPSVVGLLLTGNQCDGMNGLFDVQAWGGQTIVQDPAEALAPDMPRNALKRIIPDHLASLIDIPEMLSLCISNVPTRDLVERVP